MRVRPGGSQRRASLSASSTPLVGRERRHQIAGRFERARDGVGDLAPAVSDVRDDGAAGRIEDAAAVGEHEPGSLGARDGQAGAAGHER
jgi:hypothetical protein